MLRVWALGPLSGRDTPSQLPSRARGEESQAWSWPQAQLGTLSPPCRSALWPPTQGHSNCKRKEPSSRPPRRPAKPGRPGRSMRRLGRLGRPPSEPPQAGQSLAGVRSEEVRPLGGCPPRQPPAREGKARPPWPPPSAGRQASSPRPAKQIFTLAARRLWMKALGPTPPSWPRLATSLRKARPSPPPAPFNGEC